MTRPHLPGGNTIGKRRETLGQVVGNKGGCSDVVTPPGSTSDFEAIR